MVEARQPEDDNPDLAKSLEKSGIPRKQKQKQQPSYKVIGSTKIPVTTAHGKLWKSRRDQALTKRKSNGIETSWDEALKYYNNDQMGHRQETSGDEAGNEDVARRPNRKFSETENIVFANTRALVPTIYAKNPRVEFTATAKTSEDAKAQATMLERLVNAILRRKSIPGVNLKPKARRAVVMASLTNSAWLEVGYIQKDQSNEQSLQELQNLAAELAKAKSQKKIMEIEGALQALERKLDVLDPAGPFVKYRRPHQVLKDPDSIEDDGSDAAWMMVYDFVSTAFIAQVYGIQDKTGDFKSIYEATHVLSAAAQTAEGVDDEVNNFTLIQDGESFKKYGFSDQESFERAQRTKVWWVWDKITRRVYMYNDKSWTWPIWVWDDPYKLDTFFPLFPLSFYTNPEGGESKGEVTYYLDQQDAINEINDTERRARLAIMRHIAYNKNTISPEDFERIMKGPTDEGLGLDIPEGSTLKDNIFSVAPPSINFPQIFDTSRKLDAISRISSVTDVIRGVQFKTNTTNRAIDSYESTTATVLDEKTDAVETMIGDVGWAIAQMCMQFMEAQDVATVIGEELAKGWETHTSEEIRRGFDYQVIGGSAQKPTSQAKKREAVEVGQVLGQFARTTPAAILVALKVFEQAFDEITINEEDWQFLQETIKEQLQRGNSEGGDGQGGQGGAKGVQGGGDVIEQISQLVDSLPPSAKQALGTAISRGVPVRDALEQIVQAVQGSNGGRQEGETQQ